MTFLGWPIFWPLFSTLGEVLLKPSGHTGNCCEVVVDSTSMSNQTDLQNQQLHLQIIFDNFVAKHILKFTAKNCSEDVDSSAFNCHFCGIPWNVSSKFHV